MRRTLVVFAALLGCLVTAAPAGAAPAPNVVAALSPSSPVTAGTSRVYTAAFVVTQLSSVRYAVGLPAGFSRPTAIQLPLPTGCQKASGPDVLANGAGWSIEGVLTCKKLALFALAFKATATVAGQATLPWSVVSSAAPAQGRSGSFGFTVKAGALRAVSLAVSNAGLPANGTSRANLVAVPTDTYGNLVSAQLHPLVSLTPAGGGSAALPTVSSFAPGSAPNSAGTFVGRYTSSTTPGVATVRVKAVAGGTSVTSAPVTVTQVPRFRTRTDGEIVSFFDVGSFRPGAPALKGAGAQGLHLTWTAPQDINVGGSSPSGDLVLRIPYGMADYQGPGQPNRYSVWNGTQISGGCDLAGDSPPPYSWDSSTTTVTFAALSCHAGETLVLDLVGVGFVDPRAFTLTLDLQQVPIATSPLDVVDSATVTPQAPTHYLTVSGPTMSTDRRSATVTVALHRPNGTLDTSGTTGVEFAFGRCGETGTWQPAALPSGQTTVTLNSQDDATWDEETWVPRVDDQGNPVLDDEGVQIFDPVMVTHPLWATDNWYFRTTDQRSLLAGQSVTFGDPEAAGAIQLDGQGDVPPDYACPGSSKW